MPRRDGYERLVYNLEQVRFHYGHPDVFDRMSAITIGGISKSCKGIHLSEDIFAGFNYVLRGGEATQADYIQVMVIIESFTSILSAVSVLSI